MFDILMKEYLTFQKRKGALMRVNCIIGNGSRNFFLTVLFLLFTYWGNATTYYVSNSGNDANNGKSEDSPWRTLSKVNLSTFKAGDKILFRSNGMWREQLIVSTSGNSDNPIIFGAYGVGNKPIIDGSDIVSTWVADGGVSNVYVATVAATPKMLFRDGVVQSRNTSKAALNNHE